MTPALNTATHRTISDRSFALTIVVLGAVLALLGGVLLWNEAALFLKSGDGRGARLAPLTNGTYTTGVSVFSNRTLMLDCDEALTSTFGRLQPSAVRRSYAESCIAAADDVLARRPTDGLAYLVKANAYAFLENRDGMIDALRLSQALAPQEGWIADGRLRLALPLYMDLPDALQKAIAADVAVLASSRRSAAWLARLYLRKEKGPDVLLQILDTLPDASKGNVLAEIRTATSLR
ncbi:hypothetical protein [Pannonibacter sp. SL95]|uniref:hypothetical protein n=1 Tax=Pannonibacter sp. SL95 TaxID=2995153 RepID=UPI002276F1F5|nr:hypothetical protein [Pannonibacter sp. SL95]MCY1708339.1 hypothetical protein [Pannonibacter sp. SL95]